MMEQLDRAVAMDSSPKPVETAPTEEASTATPIQGTAKPADAAKPSEAASAAPAAPVPKAETGEPDWTKAPPKWHKIYEDHKSKTSGTIKSLEAKLKALESKPFESPGDTAKIAAYEKQIEDARGEAKTYQQRLAEVDFTKSPEYKSNFIDRANRIYQKAVSLVGQFRITDSEGNQRAAIQSDFDELRNLPEHRRDSRARELFGDDYRAITKYTDAIDQVREDADIAVAKHAENQQQTAAQQLAESRKGKEAYETQYQSALKAIQDNPDYGQWFRADDADPEASKLLQDGFDEIAKVTELLPTMPPDEQAAYAAVYRARAAAMPRMMVAYKRVAAELAAVKEELGKVRGTDPGKIAKGTSTPPTSDAKQSISGMAAMFDKSD